MQDSQSQSDDKGEVAIHLIDAQSGRPINSWTFAQKEKITIGRSPDQDVELSDPYVSRNHASIQNREG